MGGVSHGFYTATVMKTVCSWLRDRHTDQWDRTENPGTDAHKYADLGKSEDAIQWREDDFLTCTGILSIHRQKKVTCLKSNSLYKNNGK